MLVNQATDLIQSILKKHQKSIVKIPIYRLVHLALAPTARHNHLCHFLRKSTVEPNLHASPGCTGQMGISRVGLPLFPEKFAKLLKCPV